MVFAAEPGREFVGEIRSDMGNAGMQPCQCLSGLLAVAGDGKTGAFRQRALGVESLSDLCRLELAAEADMVICLYNPSSMKRADYLQKACDLMMKHKAADTKCGYVRNIGRDEEEYTLCTLSELRDAKVDMFTTVIVGNETTRVINGKLVTPRGYKVN